MRVPVKIGENTGKNIIIYVDPSETNIILPFLLDNESNYSTYFLFKQQMFENRRNKSIYKKENISNKCKNLYAIIFDSGKNQNDRIYCLEIHDGKRRIVLTKLIDKRSQKINKKMKATIEAFCNRKYSF